jgi:choline kinase
LKAIILSAGQGRRLLPLTARRPKCLVEVGGRTVLDWQLRVLAAAEVDEVAVVVGFGAEQIDESLALGCPLGMRVRTLLNPAFDRADNLISCLTARAEMTEDFLLLNGDTLFDPVVVRRLCSGDQAPVAVAVATKASYDADDMKVTTAAGRLLRVGKGLPANEVDGEAIGVSYFSGTGPAELVGALEEMARRPDANRLWYLSAVNRLAERGLVRAVSVDDAGWCEIDYPHDLEHAAALVTGWGERQRAAESSLTADERP